MLKTKVIEKNKVYISYLNTFLLIFTDFSSDTQQFLAVLSQL